MHQVKRKKDWHQHGTWGVAPRVQDQVWASRVCLPQRQPGEVGASQTLDRGYMEASNDTSFHHFYILLPAEPVEVFCHKFISYCCPFCGVCFNCNVMVFYFLFFVTIMY